MKDSLKIISNLHTHTSFSDGKGSLDEVIDSAVERGFTSLGISDHTYVEDVGFGVKYENEVEYVEKIRSAAEEYKDKITVFCGLELDAGLSCRRELYDYIIASVHFVTAGGKMYPVDLSADAQHQTIAESFCGDESLYAKAYFDTLAAHVENSKPDIIGHYDLVTKFNEIDEEDNRYREAALSALRRMIKTCSRFEVNTGAMARGYKSTPYPADFILREIKELGGTVVISSDCHDPAKIDFAFGEVTERLKKLGFTHVDRLTADGFVADEI